MSAKKSVELKTPEKKREDFEVVGAARLFKSKAMKPEDAWGLTIRPLLPDGKEDFKADAYLIWFKSIEALKTGGIANISVFKLPYREKAE